MVIEPFRGRSATEPGMLPYFVTICHQSKYVSMGPLVKLAAHVVECKSRKHQRIRERLPCLSCEKWPVLVGQCTSRHLLQKFKKQSGVRRGTMLFMLLLCKRFHH
jgi:hypothetical protein